jgi:hypothetical protein
MAAQRLRHDTRRLGYLVYQAEQYHYDLVAVLLCIEKVGVLSLGRYQIDQVVGVDRVVYRHIAVGIQTYQ